MKKIAFVAVFTALIFNVAIADSKFINDIKVDLLDPKSKEKVGEIYEGTPVETVKIEGDKTLIKVKGEVVADDRKMLAYKPDPLVIFYKLNSRDAKNDDTFLVDVKKLNDNGPEAWEEVEMLYYDSCSSCHAAHKPKEHLMSEWDAYLTAMQTFAKINDEEKARILRFMQAFAKDGIFKE